MASPSSALSTPSPAPFATRQLADLGARVIKVERPDGGDFARSYDERVRGLASHFVWCNRSKESIALDLKTEAGLEALRRLVARADVLVQNLAPGAAGRLGLDWTSLEPAYPRLILCDISGYGQDGPDCDRKAYDLLIQGESGFLSVTGTPDQPSKAGCSIADIAAGMHAYSSILAALIERQRSGKGRHIDIAMLEAMAEWMSYPMYYAFDGASPPPRVGAAHATIYPYGPFRTADGEVLLGVQNEREWRDFCTIVLGRPELIADERFSSGARRNANRAALTAAIEQSFAALLASRCWSGSTRPGSPTPPSTTWPVSGPIPSSPPATAGARSKPPPARSPRCCRRASPDARMDPVPALGEHSAAILAELGLSPDDRG